MTKFLSIAEPGGVLAHGLLISNRGACFHYVLPDFHFRLSSAPQDQHWTRRLTGDAFRRAVEPYMLQTGMTFRGNDDEIGVDVQRGSGNPDECLPFAYNHVARRDLPKKSSGTIIRILNLLFNAGKAIGRKRRQCRQAAERGQSKNRTK